MELIHEFLHLQTHNLGEHSNILTHVICDILGVAAPLDIYLWFYENDSFAFLEIFSCTVKKGENSGEKFVKLVQKFKNFSSAHILREINLVPFHIVLVFQFS